METGKKKKILSFWQFFAVFILCYLLLGVLVTLPGTLSNVDRRRGWKTESFFNLIRYKLYEYYDDYNSFPSSPEELVEKKYIRDYQGYCKKHNISIYYVREDNTEKFKLSCTIKRLFSGRIVISHRQEFDKYLKFLTHNLRNSPEVLFIEKDDSYRNPFLCYIAVNSNQEENEELINKLDSLKKQFRKKFDNYEFKYEFDGISFVYVRELLVVK